ncbi:MAG: ABC transporter permease [Bacteroidales bacterium]|nr:ABC transporter permease [Bacteroidales bacterium]
MKLPLYIAKRYLFAKKSRNAINVISGVSVAGVTVGTMALIIILSVFNGLELLITSIFNTFDPDLRITAAEGKTFIPDSTKLLLLSEINGVSCYSLTLEENAYLKYGDREYIGTIKGVDENYTKVTGIDSTMWEGEFLLSSENMRPWAVPGLGVANYLGMRVNFITPLFIYVPMKSAASSLDYENAFIRKYVFPSGIFQIEQTYDSKYVYLPLDFTRELIQEEKGVSSVEIKLSGNADANRVRKNVNNIFGEDHVIQNRYEQQEIFYKVMRSERLAIFMILTLIIVIASFNIVGSLTMLIIEKERDIEILRSLGADNKLIRRIFIFEGWLISIIGTAAGVILGFIICWLQQKYGIVRLNTSTLIMESYPVVMKLRDFIIIPATVLLIGFWAAWYPVRFLTGKYLGKHEKQPET